MVVISCKSLHYNQNKTQSNLSLQTTLVKTKNGLLSQVVFIHRQIFSFTFAKGTKIKCMWTFFTGGLLLQVVSSTGLIVNHSIPLNKGMFYSNRKQASFIFLYTVKLLHGLLTHLFHIGKFIISFQWLYLCKGYVKLSLHNTSLYRDCCPEVPAKKTGQDYT